MSGLIPGKVINELNASIRPLDPQACDAIIQFLGAQLTSMFRELSEHRSQSEGKARQVLSRKQSELLDKLTELFPDNQSIVESVFDFTRQVLEDSFDRQKGKKYN